MTREPRVTILPVAAVATLALFLSSPAPAGAEERQLAAGRPEAVTNALIDSLFDGSRLAVSPDTSFQHLLEEPTELDFGVERGDLDEDGHVTLTWSDLHVVYAVPLEAFRAVLLDFDSHADFVPRVVESPAEQVDTEPPRWRQRVKLSFRFLGFGADYAFHTEHQIEFDRGANPDRHPTGHPNDQPNQPTEFGLRFRMVDTTTETLVDSGGTWYLKEVFINDRPHTYVRYTNFAAFGRSIVGLRLALRNFGLRDVKSVMDAYFREALARTN